MDEITLIRRASVNIDESQQIYPFQEVAIITKKRNSNTSKLANIQPWMEDADGNPFMVSNMKQTKITKSPRFKRQASLILTNNWKSIQKITKVRQTIGLPVMDVGKLNSIKKINFPIKLHNKLNSLASKGSYQSNSQSQCILPSVKRQLDIERKLYLMKNTKDNSTNSSPTKSSRLRNIIKAARF